ncbi:MAG: DUF6430 domain-containing protein [bacterium]|nr:DUF6430 domain-containing protein [bacterium]
MRKVAYKKSIFSYRMLFTIGKQFLIALGVLSLFLDIIVIVWPDSFQYGWRGFLLIILLIFALAVFRAFPRRCLSVKFFYPDTAITLKVGNIFDQKGHLILGFSDTFDTDIGNIICGESIQGQFLAQVYNNDRKRLDNDLERALSSDPFSIDNTKTKGKNRRYKIGTVAVLPGEKRKFFCCAYSKMGVDLKAYSDINNLWDSLINLWVKIRIEGEQKNIFIPVIGTNLARVPGISHSLPIKLLVFSFIVNSRVEPISKELIIMIGEKDLEKVDLLEIGDFIKSFNK